MLYVYVRACVSHARAYVRVRVSVYVWACMCEGVDNAVAKPRWSI
jgi:hypothetical protein